MSDTEPTTAAGTGEAAAAGAAAHAGPPASGAPATAARNVQKPGEIGGPAGPEPTRYGDWELKGRCTDF